jgi:hypothetical protein
MPINVEQAGASDLIGRNLLRVDSETIGATPQDGSFTGGVVDQDVGALVRAILPDLDVVKVDTLA